MNKKYCGKLLSFALVGALGLSNVSLSAFATTDESSSDSWQSTSLIVNGDFESSLDSWSCDMELSDGDTYGYQIKRIVGQVIILLRYLTFGIIVMMVMH